MNVLLLNPPKFREKILLTDPILTRCTGVPSKSPYIWPPIGLAYIAGYIEDICNVNILDSQVENLDGKNVIKRCKDFDLVIINASSTTIERDLKLCKMLKEENTSKIALIGGHATYFHRELIKNDSIDFVIRGEPEKIVYNLVKNFENAKKAKGITWKKNNKIVCNKDAEIFQNLDKIPFPARHLLPKKKYYDILMKKSPFTFIITSRGCPFNCTFCSTNLYSKSKFRYRSAKNVIEEFSKVSDEGFKEVFFFDDTFTIGKKRVLEISKGIKKFGIPWKCTSRVDTVDKEMLEKMYESGCYHMQFGVESGNQRILNLMKKGIKVEQVKKVFKWCDEIGIETVAHFILGYPGEDRESIKKSVDLLHELHPDFVSLNMLTPVPGSEIFEILKPKENWENLDRGTISFCEIESKELKEIIAKIYKDYYIRLSYLFRRIYKTKEPVRIIKQNLLFWMKRSGILWEFLGR